MSIQEHIERLSNAKNVLKNWLDSMEAGASDGDTMDVLCDNVAGFNPQVFYTGTGEPSASLGKDGDLYFQTEE